MTEILTESFCERCGTRYTFETVQPGRRSLSALGTLGRGLKHFVVDSESTFDEAMATARSESEQRATNAQLEAFHRTFNFCLTCRQYTCGDCWNTVEGRCLTCAPLPEAVIPRAPVEVVAPIAEDAEPLRALFEARAATPVLEPPSIETAPTMVEAEPIVELEPEPEVEVVAEIEAEPIVELEPEPEVEVVAEIEAEPVVELEPEPIPEPVAIEPQPEVAAEPEPQAEPVRAAPEPRPAATPAPERPAAPKPPPFPGFQPGRSLDEEIAAYELRVAALATTPPEPLPPVVIEVTPQPQPPPVVEAMPQAPIFVRAQAPEPGPWDALPPPTPQPSRAAPGATGTCRACGLSISSSARFCRRCGTAQQVA